MRKVLRHLTYVAIILALLTAGLFSASLPAADQLPIAYADDPASDPADTSAQDTGDASGTDCNTITFHPGYKYVVMKQIRFPFLDTATVAYDWTFPYSDSFFRYPSDLFSLTMARGSLGMSLSAFRSTNNVVDPQYTSYLEGAGFGSIFSFGYDKPTTQDTLSGVIGMKQIDDFTVIAVVTCGQGYQKEWAGNFIVGDGVRHEGFNSAAALLEKNINDYIQKNGITGKKKIWLNGMSRAGAVANITAADFIESGEYEDVYAYLFGVPRTTKEPVAYPGIYNICGQYDPVAAIPFQSWGYERYGTDLYTPSQEACSSYSEFTDKNDKTSIKMTDREFRNNPEVNYQLHLILEFLGTFFATEKDYTDRYQQTLIDAMNNVSQADIASILQESMSRLKTISAQENTSRNVFIEYLSYMAASHMRASQRQVDAGAWVTDEPLAANLVLEHRPSTYAKWLFSPIPPEQLFLSPNRTRKLTFIGNVGISAFQNGVYIGGINSLGQLKAPSEQPESDSSLPDLFMMRNGTQTVINIPADEEYTFEVKSLNNSELTYYDQFLSSDVLMETPGRMHIGTINRGTASITVSPDTPLGPLSDGTANYMEIVDTDFECTPTVIMANELQATKYSYLTIGAAVKNLLILAQTMIAVLFICLVIWLRHRRKIKKGHAPYSDLYVIIPHLLFILTFMGLTQYVTFFLFTIGKIRTVCATITIAIIFLLAFRGLIRYPSKRNAAVALILLALIPLTYLYYLDLPTDSFSGLHMAIYFAFELFLTALAVRSFERVPSGRKAPSPETEVS